MHRVDDELNNTARKINAKMTYKQQNNAMITNSMVLADMVVYNTHVTY